MRRIVTGRETAVGRVLAGRAWDARAAGIEDALVFVADDELVVLVAGDPSDVDPSSAGRFELSVAGRLLEVRDEGCNCGAVLDEMACDFGLVIRAWKLVFFAAGAAVDVVFATHRDIPSCR